MASKKKVTANSADKTPKEVIERAVVKNDAPEYAELMRRKYASLHDAKSRCDFDNYFQASKENDEALERWHKYLQE
jgi:hypothetical protein